jgi:hypothetical protein
MSFDAIKWAINQDIDDPKEKLLLVILSDCLNDKTKQCNPSRETLMRKACIKNNKTLSAKLDSLVSRGLIEIVRGKGVSNHYLVQNRTTFSTEPSSAVNHLPSSELNHLPSSELNHLPSSAVNHEPISEPIKEPINTYVRRADPGSPDASSNETAKEEEFDLTAPKEELTPKQRSAQVGSRCPHEKIIALYHECLPMLPTVRIWSEDRRKTLAARWRTLVNDKGYQSEEEGLGWFKRLFGYIRRSRFLTGETPQKEGHTWRPDLEWIIKPKNLTKIIEGKYHVQ